MLDLSLEAVERDIAKVAKEGLTLAAVLNCKDTAPLPAMVEEDEVRERVDRRVPKVVFDKRSITKALACNPEGRGFLLKNLRPVRESLEAVIPSGNTVFDKLQRKLLAEQAWNAEEGEFFKTVVPLDTPVPVWDNGRRRFRYAEACEWTFQALDTGNRSKLGLPFEVIRWRPILSTESMNCDVSEFLEEEEMSFDKVYQTA